MFSLGESSELDLGNACFVSIILILSLPNSRRQNFRPQIFKKMFSASYIILRIQKNVQCKLYHIENSKKCSV